MDPWLDADVAGVEGMSARAAGQLRSAFGIARVRDLLEHYPHRYRDTGAAVPISEGTLGEPITVVGTVAGWKIGRPQSRGGARAGARGGRGRRLTIARADVHDALGNKVEAAFFNQEWRARQAPEGTLVAVSGTLERYRGALQLRSPRLEVLGDGENVAHRDRLEPVYPATEALPSWKIAQWIVSALDRLPEVDDPLPASLRQRHGLLPLDAALRSIHRPQDFGAARRARDRLVYDELLCLQVGLQSRRLRLEADALGLAQEPVPGGLAERFLSALPFAPTAAQHRAFEELGADLARPKPMHRLLQGDVGSGKTLVAVWVMLTAVDQGRQAVLMAPTEVLAEQHARTLETLLAPLGVNVLDGPRLELLTGGTSVKRLRGLLAELVSGDVQLVVGTHALLEERVQFNDLGVVVVDEQHRFGVEHRARLRDKRMAAAPGQPEGAGLPDVLVMTATPIPRSLALTVYGDLDVTVLDELPPGRQPVATRVIPAESPRRERLEAFIRDRVAEGERVYVVCPLVEESEALRVATPEGDRSVAAAETTYRRLAEEIFPDVGVALVHGRLPAQERDAAMEAFRSGAVQILVATTVIEVGVDVAEATVMVIEDADRFGISQLHQLRGRVGRGTARSYCVLFSADPEENERLAAVAETTDGFRLAEKDLELRGEGSLFDTRQSGLPDLKLAKLLRDYDWVVRTRQDARALVEEDLELEGWPGLRAEVVRRYGEERLAALETG